MEITQKSFIDAVVEGVNQAEAQWLRSYLDPMGDATQIEESAQEILHALQQNPNANNSKRYKAKPQSHTDVLVKLIFEKSFEANHSKLISMAEQLTPEKKNFYPLWRKVCQITLTNTVGHILQDKVYRFAVTFFAAYWSFQAGYAMYKTAEHLMLTVGVPFFINNVPLIVVQSFNKLYSFKERVCEITITVYYINVLAQIFTSNPEMIRVCEKVNAACFVVFVFVLEENEILAFAALAWEGIKVVANFYETLGVVGKTLVMQSKKEEKEMLLLCRQKTFEVWQTAVHDIKHS